MDRRAFVISTAAAVLPWRIAFAQSGWRTFEVTTRAEVDFAEGVSRVWLPLPLTADTEWHRSLGSAWSGSSTRDRAVDVSRPDANAKSLSPAEYAFYTAPTEWVPTDGIVRDTARGIVKGAGSDVEKARAIYEWVVDNTFRDPKVRGCGWGDIKTMLETGNLGGKCGDLNALFVGLARSVGVPARDVYGIRVAASAHGYRSLGVGTPMISKAQHCRAEFYAQGAGWVPVDPADVRKVVLEEPPGKLAVSDPKVVAARKRLFGSWEMNWA